MTVALREDVACCVANKRVALMDLRTERYYCLPERADAAFQDLIRCPDVPSELAMGPLKFLFERGLLIGSGAPVHPIRGPIVPEVNQGIDLSGTTPRALMVCEALISQGCTWTTFKTRSLLSQINRLRRRKGRSRVSTPSNRFSELSRALSSFHFTKRLISNQDQCLRRSVALVDFLARRRIYPDLVIGVRLAPFSFHAWVQTGDTVLNDEVDTVRPYTPILVV